MIIPRDKPQTLGWVLSLVLAPVLGAPTALQGQDSNEVVYPIEHQIQSVTEIIWSPGLELTDSSLSYGQTIQSWEWSLGLTYKTYREEYETNPPFDALGFDKVLNEENVGGQVSISKELNDVLTLSASGGGYEGFEGYRAVWLANYYDQQFNFVPGYRDPDPRGFNGSGGLRWEYLPASGYLDARVSYFQDDVAPGYEIDLSTGMFRLLHGPDTLKSWSYYLATENILSQRIRTLLEFQATDTTAREWRYSVQGSINVALGDSWFWRNQAGYTDENPEFEAWFGASTLEWEVTSSLLLSLSGRYYKDTGEIENSLLLSNAAPELEAWQVGLGLRYIWSNASLKLFGGPYFTNYDPIDIGTAPWKNLYTDRNWGLAQIAFSVQF